MASVSISTLNDMKARGEKITVLTSYDATFTALCEAAGVEVLLVGDSLGMVIQGHESTLPVSMDQMVYHTRCVCRARQNTLVIADMPFMGYATPEQALHNAGRLMKEGKAQMVKLEGGAPQIETVRHLTRHAVPVCAHLGLQPQSVHQLGGYKVQGRDPKTAQAILSDARALQEAGAQMLVLECVPQLLAAEVTAALDIPVIGIGAGVDVDGQVLVIYDMLGLGMGKMPRFVRNFLGDGGNVLDALKAYVEAVKQKAFPAEEHCFS